MVQKPTSSQTDSPASCRRAAVVSSRWERERERERERETIDESTAAAAAISDKEAVIPELPLLSLPLSPSLSSYLCLQGASAIFRRVVGHLANLKVNHALLIKFSSFDEDVFFDDIFGIRYTKNSQAK